MLNKQRYLKFWFVHVIAKSASDNQNNNIIMQIAFFWTLQIYSIQTRGITIYKLIYLSRDSFSFSHPKEV